MPFTKRIAAIVTEYRPNAHADVIMTKFLTGFPTDGGLISPRVQIASLYVDQFPHNDLSRQMAAAHDVPIYGSIVKALTLGGESLAVDGVLIIGEHGDYAWNERDQHLYPRKYFMEQVCGVIARSGRSIPVFSDKHLSYNWHDALWMVERARSLNVPFMAGSSLPLAWRDPWLEHPPDVRIEEALAIGYAGLDIYGFHALETLQCMVERRVGGETGVVAVTCLEGDAVWEAAQQGLWSRELADAAITRIGRKAEGAMETRTPHPALFHIEYRDGLRAHVLMLDGFVEEFAYAARVLAPNPAPDEETQQVVSTLFRLAGGPPHGHFSYLSLNVEEMFVTGQPTYPVERTLLTTGVLEAALESRYRGHVRVETPHLDVAYTPAPSVPWRPTDPRPRQSPSSSAHSGTQPTTRPKSRAAD